MHDSALAKDGVKDPRIRIVNAVQHIRKMRGGAQSHLMFCSDGGYYVVKFQNNPQHRRVLVNEMLASLLARPLALPIPEAVIVRVDASLVHDNPEMTITLEHSSIACHAGLQFGSKYAIKPTEGRVFDYMPPDLLGNVRNREQFAGVLVLDKWLCNVDRRQAAFWRRSRERRYTAAFIDQGHCFNAKEWTFPDDPQRGAYPHNEAYVDVRGWESFEPCLVAIDATSRNSILDAAGAIPPEWSGNDWTALKSLALELLRRGQQVRELVTAFRFSRRLPFPNWEGKKKILRRLA